jgi:hypothetical protein
MAAHDQQLGGRRLLEQPDGGVVLADYATYHNIGITFTPAGKALGELFFGLCGDAIPRYVDLEVGVVHPRVESDQSNPAPRRLVESDRGRQFRGRRPVDPDHNGGIGAVHHQVLTVDDRHRAVRMVHQARADGAQEEPLHTTQSTASDDDHFGVFGDVDQSGPPKGLTPTTPITHMAESTSHDRNSRRPAWHAIRVGFDSASRESGAR